MRIEEIYVDGFGLMANATLTPAPGLTVVRGLNEAGKTTLLSFVRSMLFGFEPRRYAAMAGGRRGGRLTVSMTDGRQYKVERYGERGGGGTLRVYDDQGVDRGPDELGRLLQNVDAQLFRNVFAYGLAELAEFSNLNGQEVAARIYGAGLGLGSVSAVKVEGDFGGRASNLFKPGGSAPEINVLLKGLEVIDASLRGRDLPAEHRDKSRRLAEVELERDEISARLTTLDEEVRRYDRQRKAWPAWIALRDGSATRGDLGDVPALSLGVGERLARYETQRDGAVELHDRAAVDLARQREAVAQLNPDPLVLEHRQAIEDLSREVIRDRDRRKELEVAERDVLAATRTLADALVRLGHGWTEERVAAFDDSVAVQTEISGRFRALLDTSATTLTTVTRNRTDLGRLLVAERAESATLDAQIASVRDEERALPAVDVLDRALRELDGAIGLRGRVADQAVLADQAAAAAEARVTASPAGLGWAALAGEARMLQGVMGQEALLASLASPLVAPAATLSASGVGATASLRAAVIGAAAVVIAVVVAILGIPLPVAAGVVALGVIGVVLAWRSGQGAAGTMATPQATSAIEKQRLRLAASRAALAGRCGLEPDAAATEVEGLLRGCAEAERVGGEAALLRAAAVREAAALQSADAGVRIAAAAAGLPPRPSEEDLAAARAQLAEARERQARRQGMEAQADTLRRRIEGREREFATAETALADATAESSAAQAEWTMWLRDHDLDGALDRETAARVIDAVTAAKAPLRSRAIGETRVATIVGARAAFATTAVELAAALGQPPSGASADDVPAMERLIVGLETALAAALDAERGRSEAIRTAKRLEADQEAAQEALEAADQELAALLAAHGVEDAASLRGLIDLGSRAGELDEAIRGATRTLEALSGPGVAFERLTAELELVEDIADVDSRHAEAEAQFHDLDAERSGLHEQIGELRDAVTRMEHDAAATAERQRKSDLAAQLEARAERWATYTLARVILATARHAYEAEHRPAVLRTAEAYFREWTAGRYRQIIAPDGRQVEAVEHKDGTLVPLEHLSTGTAQQLYLAIRFGLLEHFAQAAEPLPVVMDDILVNFDAERARLAARSIEELAKRQQVLYFTCHPEIPLDSTNVITLPRLKSVADRQDLRPAEFGEPDGTRSLVASGTL